MSKTAVIFSPKSYQHYPGKDHPESARRLQRIIDELKRSRLFGSDKCQLVEPVKADVEDIKLVHGLEYVRHVQTVCKNGGGMLDEADTAVSPESFETAVLAVGGTLTAANLVMEKKFENAFALVRPPGHHASRFQACGFCVFNNVAIAAKHLLKQYGLRRILILDIDAHHGNGTQETFYDTRKVLYISLHEDPTFFPKTGFVDEVGEGEGLGYNVNIPLPFKTTDQTYLRAVKEIVAPVASQYRPDFILVSAGLDGHYADPVGELSLSALCYKRVYEVIMKLASETCQGRLVAVLEGGYGLRFVGKIGAALTAEMSGAQYAINDRVLTAEKNVKIRGEKAIEEVKKLQSVFWNLD